MFIQHGIRINFQITKEKENNKQNAQKEPFFHVPGWFRSRASVQLQAVEQITVK